MHELASYQQVKNGPATYPAGPDFPIDWKPAASVNIGHDAPPAVGPSARAEWKTLVHSQVKAVAEGTQGRRGNPDAVGDLATMGAEEIRALARRLAEEMARRGD